MVASRFVCSKGRFLGGLGCSSENVAEMVATSGLTAVEEALSFTPIRLLSGSLHLPKAYKLIYDQNGFSRGSCCQS